MWPKNMPDWKVWNCVQRFEKFNSKQIERIKIAHPISRLIQTGEYAGYNRIQDVWMNTSLGFKIEILSTIQWDTYCNLESGIPYLDILDEQ